MSFDFDPTNPLDSSLVSAFPANERNSRNAIQDAFELEHTEATGRHAFGVGTTATRDGQSGIATGMIWFNTDRVAGATLLDVYSGSAWVETAFSMLDVVQKWTKTQYGTPVAVTPGAGSPNTLDWNLADGAFFKATITAASPGTEMQAPTTTGLLATDSAHFTWQITQDATGSRPLTFASPEFIPAFGGQPEIDPDPSAATLIHITKLSDATLFRYIYRVELLA